MERWLVDNLPVWFKWNVFYKIFPEIKLRHNPTTIAVFKNINGKRVYIWRATDAEIKRGRDYELAHSVSCKWCGRTIIWKDNPKIARCLPDCSTYNKQ